jgi:hypothetical protein
MHRADVDRSRGANFPPRSSTGGMVATTAHRPWCRDPTRALATRSSAAGAVRPADDGPRTERRRKAPPGCPVADGGRRVVRASKLAPRRARDRGERERDPQARLTRGRARAATGWRPRGRPPSRGSSIVWMPNERPIRACSASAATSTAFGASLPPLPTPSATLNVPTTATDGASAISGRAAALREAGEQERRGAAVHCAARRDPRDRDPDPGCPR